VAWRDLFVFSDILLSFQELELALDVVELSPLLRPYQVALSHAVLKRQIEVLQLQLERLDLLIEPVESGDELLAENLCVLDLRLDSL